MQIVTLAGTEDVQFGMTPHQVRRALKSEPDACTGPDNIFGTVRERYPIENVFVEYDRAGRCCALEFYAGASVIVEGTEIMQLNFSSLAAFVRARDPYAKEDADGIRSDALGLAAYAPQKANPKIGSQAPIESLLIFQRGYYDELDTSSVN